MKKACSILLVVLMLFVVFGCSQNDVGPTNEGVTESSPGEKESGKVYNFSYTTALAPTSDFHQEVELPFIKMLEEKSGGRIKVDVFAGGSLATFGTGIDGVLNDMITLAFDNFGSYPGKYPLADMFNMPGLGTPTGEMGCNIYREYLNTIGASEIAGVKVFTPVHCGPYGLMSIEPIASTADFAGKQIRVPAANSVEAVAALGAAPVEMPVGDIYEALKLNIVDGLIASPDTITAYNLKEVTNYITIMPGFGAAMVIAMSEEFYKSLPADLQQVIDEVSEEAFNITKTFFDTKNEKTIRESNMQLVEVSDEQYEEWNKIFQATTWKYAESLDKKGLPGTETFNWILEQIELYK